MSDEMAPALSRLQAKLQQQLEDARKTKLAINALHEAFDQPAPYTDLEEDAFKTIRRGQFYGQPLATCMKTILEMRRAAGRDAATVNEIFEALKLGGYLFEAKDDENAKNGLRVSLRKNTDFHRIPSGEWGLLSWYPNARADREAQPEKNGDAKKGTQPSNDGAAENAAGTPDQAKAEPQTEASRKKKANVAAGDKEQAASVT